MSYSILGAIVGDMVGSTREWKNVKTEDFELLPEGSRFTDDTVMTLAVAEWLMTDSTHSKEKLIDCMQRLGRKYPNAGYGGMFSRWLKEDSPKPYKSFGNGSAMRVSPEGIKGAQAIAACVYLKKTEEWDVGGEIKKYIEEKFGYDLSLDLDEIREGYAFDVTCQGSVPIAIMSYLKYSSYPAEKALRMAISMGGDSLELSSAYLARMYLKEQALQRYGNDHHEMKDIRGMAPMTLRLLSRYGAMPFNSFRAPDTIDYHLLLRKLQRMADHHRIQRTGLEALGKEADQLLDDEIAPLPLWVFMLGCQYTPIEFAHSVAGKDEYVSLTSFMHHPFGQRIALEVPDNRYQDEFLNVPVDSLTRYVIGALKGGHPVCWEGDISESLFNFSEGIAQMPDETRQVTQADRQKAFDRSETTDDHCMEMVGLAHDQQGRRFFICKNSWGTDNRYRGFMLLSENYFRAKTICVTLHTEALPEMNQIVPPQKDFFE